MAPQVGDTVFMPLKFDEIEGGLASNATVRLTINAISGDVAKTCISDISLALSLLVPGDRSGEYQYAGPVLDWHERFNARRVRIEFENGHQLESRQSINTIEILDDKVLVYLRSDDYGWIVFGTTLTELSWALATRPFIPYSDCGEYLVIETDLGYRDVYSGGDVKEWRQRVRRWAPKSRAAVAWEKGLQQARDAVKNSVAPSFPKKKPQEKQQEKPTAEPSRPPIGVALNSAKAGEYVSVCVTGGTTLIDTAVAKALTPESKISPSMLFNVSYKYPESIWRNQFTNLPYTTQPLQVLINDCGSSTRNPIPIQKEETMTTNNPVTTPTPFDKTVADAGAAIVHGASVAAAQEAYDAVLELVTMTGLPSTALGFLQTTMFGRVLLYVGLPTVLMFLCNMFPSSIPQAGNVNRACKLVIDGASRDFLRPMFAVMASPLKKLAAIGASAVETPPSAQK